MDLKKHILLCQEGDRVSQKMLYEYLFKHFFNIPSRYVKCKEERWDVFNSSVLKIFQSLSKRLSIDNFQAWSRTIIFRTTIDHLRKVNRLRSKTLLSGDPVVFEKEHSRNGIFEQLEADEIFTVIQSLPEHEMQVFSLFEIDGYKHAEIASLVGISVSNSKYLLCMSKKHLRQKLLRLGYLSKIKV